MKTTKSGHYKWSDQTIKVPENDTDINIILPNGERYCFQYRIENQTVDLCIGSDKTLSPLQKICYLEDGSLGAGKKIKGLPAHARMAAQIAIVL